MSECGEVTTELWNDIEDAINDGISEMVRKYPDYNHYTIERLFLAALLRDINAGKRRLVEFAGGSNRPPRGRKSGTKIA